jgi:ABC-2 type transport system permease protein
MNLLLPAFTLWQREIVRFFRQKNRVVGALASPIVFWLLIGSGLNRSFRAPGIDTGYLEYFFPGTLLLIMLFTAIFSTISIIEDRREGFLQGVLVAPVGRAAIVWGKLLGGTVIAVIQALLFCAAAPFIGISLGLFQMATLAALLVLVGFGLTALGYLIAWPLDSTQGFHAIMNLFLIPLWLMSGALFPAEGASRWMQIVIHFNPLHYGLSAIRAILYPGAVTGPSLGLSLIVLVAFAVILLFACLILTHKHSGKTS